MTIPKTRMALLVVGCLLFILFAATAPAPLQAQTTDDIWSTPENISQSGAATDLVVTTDNSGQIVLLWRDALAGFMVTQGDGTDWATPQNVRLPFSDPPFGSFDDLDFTLFTPTLVIDDAQQVHGFWRNEENELFYSRVALADLAVPEAWSVPLVLAESAVSLDAALAANGQLHLVMTVVQSTEEFPAGIYYRRSEDGGVSWTEAVDLYQSDYLRTVTSDRAHAQIALDDTDHVFVVWDNPALDSVFAIRSPNGGVGWTTPMVVDQRESGDATDSQGPSLINVVVHESEVHLTWQAGHGGESCEQYHQVSLDSGENWQQRQVAVKYEASCPTYAYLLMDDAEIVFMVTAVEKQAFLQAWNGEMWSEGVEQTTVLNFTNPLTNRLVTASCIYPLIGRDNQLMVFGCGLSTNGALSVQDIWVQERPLGMLEDWFTDQNMIWSNPVQLATEQAELNTPIILTDQEGLFHAFWIGATTDMAAENATAIFYVHWNGVFWSQPAPVLPVTADQIAVAIDTNNDLLVTWHDPVQDKLLFSRADQERAMFPLEWSAPKILPVGQSNVSWPNLFVDTEGQIQVTYAVPLNENRGIYITQSQDGGTTWSDPVTVFDAEASGWSMVGRLHILQTENGDLHALWQQLSLPIGSNPLALYYANSQDDGQTWSAATMITANPAQWGRLISIDPQTIFRLWQEPEEEEEANLWYQQSIDGGQNWSDAVLIFEFGESSQAVDVVVAPTGQVYLLKMINTDGKEYTLRQWTWQGNNWLLEDDITLSLSHPAETEIKFAAAINDNGRLIILYSQTDDTPEDLDTLFGLYFMERIFTLPEPATILSPPPITATPTVSFSVETPTPQTLPTEQPVFSTVGTPIPSSPLPQSPIGNIIVGLLPAGLIVVSVVIFSLFFSRSRKNS